jgi:hypothetical protein
LTLIEEGRIELSVTTLKASGALHPHACHHGVHASCHAHTHAHPAHATHATHAAHHWHPTAHIPTSAATHASHTTSIVHHATSSIIESSEIVHPTHIVLKPATHGRIEPTHWIREISVVVEATASHVVVYTSSVIAAAATSTSMTPASVVIVL